MSLSLATQPSSAAVEKVLLSGDLSGLDEAQRLAYYNQTCQSLGLNPFTQPFEYIRLNGKLKLYAKKDATDQLRKLHGVSIDRIEKERLEDVYVVTAYAKDAAGRSDSSVGAVQIGNLKGEALANAVMKAETKAKRRVTLSICGLGMLDETEAETIRDEKPPLVVSAPAAPAAIEAAALPDDGQLRVVKVGPPKHNGPYAYIQVVLSDGREVIAKDDAKNNYGMITLLEQVCQAQEAIEVVTRRVKARGDKPDYDLVEEVRRVQREDVVELKLAPEDMTF